MMQINTKKNNTENIQKNLKFLKILSKKFPNVRSATTEIINLQAILHLPKATEYFLSDVHGEHEAFNHVMRNGSGTIREKVNTIFKNIEETERKNLTFLIYYPKEKLEIIKRNKKDIALKDWYEITLERLVKLAKEISSKYTRSKLRKSLPKNFNYIIDELINEREQANKKQEYYDNIIKTIIELDRADDFIITISELIQRLVIDHLHIIGDIYDRGPGAEIIMDTLMNHHSVDIQWGNHDILWIGAAMGSEASIANVVRIALRYGNTDTLEEGYGINLLPLARFAMEVYSNEQNPKFNPKESAVSNFSKKDVNLIRKMHKAISIIQFKMEEQLILRRPDYQMNDRLILDKINVEKGTVTIRGKSYKLNDTYFPTICDTEKPYKMTEAEKNIIMKLTRSFINSEKLQKHVKFLFSKGAMYTVYNNHLLYHGGIPMNEDGTLTVFEIDGIKYSGKTYLDFLEQQLRSSYLKIHDKELRMQGQDRAWYLWCGAESPLFGKKEMTTFERYFIDDKTTHKERKNPYYKFREEEHACDLILENFGLDPKNKKPNEARIFSGHVPVIVKKGENPIKANGKMIVIDGGFSKAYQPKTGIAGYTLLFKTSGVELVKHESFESTQKSIKEELDIISSQVISEKTTNRLKILDTDIGKNLKQQIDDLKLLLFAYKNGIIKTKTNEFE